METFRILMGASLELKKAQNCMQNRMTGWKNVIKFYGDAAFINFNMLLCSILEDNVRKSAERNLLCVNAGQ